MATEENTAVKGYKINFTNNTITVNYTFKKASEEYGTAEYDLLKNILADFPKIHCFCGLSEICRKFGTIHL